MEDLLSFKRCSFCNLFSAIQCMMQELKDDHVRKSHSLEKRNNDCVQNVQKQNGENKNMSLNVAETTTVAEVSFKTETVKERSDEYFRDDSADDNSKYATDDTNYDVGVSIVKDYNKDTMKNYEANFDNNDDNSNFTNETNNDNFYNFDEFISNSNETTMNIEDKNNFTNTDQDNLKDMSDTNRSIIIPSNADEKENLKIRLSNKSKTMNHFQIKEDTKIKDVCNYCGKVVKRKAGSFLKHLRYKHKDKLPVEQHKSIAWNHFNPVPNNSKKAECKYCGKWMSKIYGSTSSLINHLKIKHQPQLVNKESKESIQSSDNQKTSRMRKSIIWSHCKLEPNSDKIECNYCNKVYVNYHGSTSNMQNHLKINHPEKLSGKVSNSSVEADGGLMEMLIDDKGTFNNYEENYSNVVTSDYIEPDDQESIDDGEDSNIGDGYNEFSATTEINEHHGSMDTFFEDDPDIETDEKYTNTKDTKSKFTMNYNDPDDALRVLDIKEFQQSIDDQNLISTKVRKSVIWSHCKLEPNSDKIECNYCNKVYINAQGSTSNMKNHLKNKHPQKLCGKGSKANLLLENFKPQRDVNRKIECKYCGVWISNSNGSTTQMLKHLRIEHEDLMKSRTDERKINDKKSNRSLVWDYFNPPEILVMKCSYSTCGELFSNPDGNNSDMIKHLQVKHPSKMQAFKEDTKEKST